MKNNIFIYEKNGEILEFLRSFFRKKKNLHARFFEDVESFKARLSGRRHEIFLCIIPSDEIKRIKPLKSGCPSIVTISCNAKAGIRDAAKYGADGYVLNPIQPDDLDFKIRSILNRESEKAHLQRLVITDYLTGIYNIRYFYSRLAEEFYRSERYGLPLSCLMLDIDHFKSINDNYGHKAGDIILRQLAQLMKKHIRKSDVLARYGGEEFIIFFPQTNEKAALLKAESLRAEVEKRRFAGLKRGARLTVSIGVASYGKGSIKSIDNLITSADNALYKAKAMGRNQVVANSGRAR